MSNRLSVVIDTYNEASVLPRCLKSVKNIADEIIVCDENSTDNSIDLAKKYGAKVITHERVQYVELVRNFEVAKATGDWILVVDPDEEISDALGKKILDVIKDPKADYYYIPRKNIIFGKWMVNSRWWPDMNLRLFKRGSVSWTDVIHKQPLAKGVGLSFAVEEDLAIIHHHYDSVEQYIERMNRYTTQQAKAKVAEDYEFKWQDLINKPVDEFLSRYFFGKGYKDGIHGLALSLLQAFSELVVYLKIWQDLKFKDGQISVTDAISHLKLKEKDIHYWQNDTLYKETGSLSARLKRKLRV